MTEPFGAGWSRNYNGLDARMEAFGGQVILHRHRVGMYMELGQISDWERADPFTLAACAAAK